MNRYNIIIPVAYKDYNIVGRTVESLFWHIKPEKILILTDIRFQKYLPKMICNNPNCIVIDENELLPYLSFTAVKECAIRHHIPVYKTGWLLQQFLKLGFAMSGYCDTDYYLSWDADTLCLRPIKFFDDEGKILMTAKKEHHQPYFDAISRLLGDVNISPYSYICEQMMFKTDYVHELLTTISKGNAEKGGWIEAIIAAITKGEPNGFSEFETYGTFCENFHAEDISMRYLNTFRKGGYIAGRFLPQNKLQYLAFDLDTISLELGDYPVTYPYKLFCYIYKHYIEIKYKVLNNFTPPRELNSEYSACCGLIKFDNRLNNAA